MKTYSIVVACFLALPISAQQTLLVPSQYPTIQAAINAAANGDTVSVSAGTYIESIDFMSKGITVRAPSGPAATVIDGLASAATVTIYNIGALTPVIEGFTITRSVPTSVPGIRRGFSVIGASPIIRNCSIVGHASDGAGAGAYLETSTPIIENCIFSNNVARNGPPYGHATAGAVYFTNLGAGWRHLTVRRCRFLENRSVATIVGEIPEGGAVFHEDFTTMSLTSCVFVGNSCLDGAGSPSGVAGALRIRAYTDVFNCTFTGNVAGAGTAIHAAYGGAGTVIRNTIIWNDTLVDPGNSTVVLFCDIQNGWNGQGNINIDPSFVNAAAGDVHLAAGSPCIDTGDANLIVGSTLDIDGDPRVTGSAVDIGADEFPAGTALGTAGTGNVGLGLGGPFDLLTINGSAGLPARRVDVSIGSPITISVAQPPTNPLASSFALIGFIGVPTPADAYTLPFGIGTLCFPAPQLNPSYPGLFTLTNNFGPEPGQLVGSNPAPWSFTAAGLPFAFQFTLQGVIQQDPGTVRVMNGVLVNIQ